MDVRNPSTHEVTELKRELTLEKTNNARLRLEVTKLQESLDETKRQLSELQERVHLSEQVTAATQQRELCRAEQKGRICIFGTKRACGTRRLRTPLFKCVQSKKAVTAV